MKKSGNKVTVHYQHNQAGALIKKQLIALVRCVDPQSARRIVALCIGSDRYTGDALGPLIGTLLSEQTDAVVYGTLDNPVHAGNLVETVQGIQQTYDNPLIIAIDACLGRYVEIGNIEIWQGGLQAGIAVGNHLPKVGHVSLIGVVNTGSPVGYLDLQTTPLSIVMKLSKIIGGAMVGALASVMADQSARYQAAAAKST